MQKHLPIALILVVYLIVGSLFAIYTPDWQSRPGGCFRVRYGRGMPCS